MHIAEKGLFTVVFLCWVSAASHHPAAQNGGVRTTEDDHRGHVHPLNRQIAKRANPRFLPTAASVPDESGRHAISARFRKDPDSFVKEILPPPTARIVENASHSAVRHGP
jgi:hypothetical protein